MEEILEWRRERMKAASDSVEGGQAALGRMLGYKDGSYVGQMIRGLRPITEETVLRLEARHEFRHWFARSPNATNKGGDPYLYAHPVSQEPETIPLRPDLTAVLWRDEKMLRAQQRFTVVAPDDAMAPVILRGEKGIFDRSYLPASTGDIVLLKDMADDWHIREYQGAPDGKWYGKPQNERALTLDSREHGLEVLAVFDGTTGRRGRGV